MIVSLMLTLRPALRLLGADGEAPSVTAAAATAAAARTGRCEPFAIVDAEGQAEERVESASSRQVRRLLPEVPPVQGRKMRRTALLSGKLCLLQKALHCKRCTAALTSPAPRTCSQPCGGGRQG